MRLGHASIVILLVLWVLTIGLSLWAYTQTPTDMGFTRGLNRIMGFLSWQLAAAILALGLWIGVRPLEKGTVLRWLGRIPGWWSLTLGLGLIVLIIFTAIAVNRDRVPLGTMAPPGPPTQTVD